MWSRDRTKAPGAASPVLVLDVEGMHCGSCGLTIDDAVEELPEVSRSTTSYKKRTTQAVLVAGADADRVAQQVVQVVADAGYRASVRSG